MTSSPITCQPSAISLQTSYLLHLLITMQKKSEGLIRKVAAKYSCHICHLTNVPFTPLPSSRISIRVLSPASLPLWQSASRCV